MGKKTVHSICAFCKTTRPHTDDPLVAEIVALFSDPASLVQESQAALLDLRASIIDDINARRFFAWQTRLRQIEEIYIKALYCVFFADNSELLHILSGHPPNSILPLYRIVNKVIFEGRKTWELEPPEGISRLLKPLNILHGSAHASYHTIFTALAYAQQQVPTTYAENLVKHITTYADRLQYVRDMLTAGRDKETIMLVVRNMHRPLSYWQERMRTPSPAEEPPVKEPPTQEPDKDDPPNNAPPVKEPPPKEPPRRNGN